VLLPAIILLVRAEIGDCAMGITPDAPLALIPGQRVDLNSIIGDKQSALMPANGCLVALGRRPTTDKKCWPGEAVMLQE
jgi:hypothetical protein